MILLLYKFVFRLLCPLSLNNITNHHYKISKVGKLEQENCKEGSGVKMKYNLPRATDGLTTDIGPSLEELVQNKLVQDDLSASVQR